MNLCFIYLGIFSSILIKKNEMIYQLILAFIIGLLVDIINNSSGIFSFSCTLMIYSRYLISKLLLPRINFKRGIYISIKKSGSFYFIGIMQGLSVPQFTYLSKIFILPRMPATIAAHAARSGHAGHYCRACRAFRACAWILQYVNIFSTTFYFIPLFWRNYGQKRII